MLTNKIYINGKDYSIWASGLDDITESFTLQDDGTIELGQSSTVTLTGEAYDYLFNELFLNSCEAINREYDVKIKIPGCGVTLDFVLKAQGVSFDTVNCKAKLNLNTKNPLDDANKTLSSGAFTEQGFVEWAAGNNRIKRMLFVNEMSLITKIVAIFWHIILFPVIEFLKFLIKIIINPIITAVNTLPGVDIPTVNTDFFEDIGDDVIGAGEYTTVFYVYDIFKFWCDKAGLNFQSSILETDPYQDSVLFCKQYGRGIEIDDCDSVVWDKDNDPNMTPVEVFNLVKPLHNADWRIIDGTLFYERVDFFDSKTKEAFNLEATIKANNVVNSFEYTFDNSTNYARFNAEYQFDTIDTQGNRAIPFYRYIAEWNPGRIHKNRKGEFNPLIQLGAVRCTEDLFRDSVNSFFWKSSGKVEYTHSVVLAQGFASSLKVFILQKTPSIFHKGCPFYFVSKAQLTPPNNNSDPNFPDLTGRYEYNYDYWMKNLYDRFWFINAPDNNQLRFVEINNLTVKSNDFCSLVNFMRENKMNTFVSSKYGSGKIEGFTINYKSCSIQFSGIKIKCNGG